METEKTYICINISYGFPLDGRKEIIELPETIDYENLFQVGEFAKKKHKRVSGFHTFKGIEYESENKNQDRIKRTQRGIEGHILNGEILTMTQIDEYYKRKALINKIKYSLKKFF